MTPDSILQTLTTDFKDVVVTSASGDHFVFHDPDSDPEKTRMFPFATLVTSDKHDNFSDLDRPDVFRLNIGVSKATYQGFLGTKKFEDAKKDTDFTALDTIMPHPVYGMMHWICILNPRDETFETVKSLLAEAYEIAVKAAVTTSQ